MIVPDARHRPFLVDENQYLTRGAIDLPGSASAARRGRWAGRQLRTGPWHGTAGKPGKAQDIKRRARRYADCRHFGAHAETIPAAPHCRARGRAFAILRVAKVPVPMAAL